MSNRRRVLQPLLALGIAATWLACTSTQAPPPVTQPPQAEPPQPDASTPPESAQFGPTEVPSEAIGLYGEAAAFAPLQPGTGAATVTLDLAELLQGRKAETALLVPYDADRFYEPARAAIEGTSVRGDLPLDKPVLVVLELGPIATNNYRLLNQLASYRQQYTEPLEGTICSQILCATDVFKADQITTRVPELGPVQSRVGFSVPPADVGQVEPRPSACEKCLARWPSVLPCLLTRCKEFPLPRKVRVRKNIYALTSAEIESLRAGVAAMKARPETDPTSWIYQAKMHAVDSGSAGTLQDSCQHRQFFFFPWHRMYVFYFERILRKASGNPELTLPYWNYSDIPAQRVIPEPYRLPSNTSNPLYDPTRAAVYNAGAPLPAADVSYAAGFASLDFTAIGPGTTFGGGTVTSPQHFPFPGASGLIERSPHNNVHNDVNGNMARGESPRDPVFWLHHSNIDRLWNKWIELGAPRSNPTSDANWMNQTFSFFDENGAQVSLTGATILNTVDQLGYRYDDDPYAIAPFWPLEAPRGAVGLPPAQNIAPAEVVLEQKGEVRLTDKPSTVPMRLPQDKRAVLQKSVDTKVANERYFLELRGVRFDEPVGITYLVFLNLPPKTRKPDEKHPNFVGTLGFFGAHGAAAPGGHHDHGDAGITESYDITELVKRLGKITDLKLTLIPSYPEVPADRKDLADLVKKMKPAGAPRIAEVAILKRPAP